ncbi:PGAP1-like protein [Paraburkholderia sp. BL8N3]|nr:PGAP1-like protein [Paraburkholderia sp. BL8N3]
MRDSRGATVTRCRMAARYPIIYIRGYAMTESERNETAADPFCGFNVGSTLYRAVPDKTAKPARFIFESPLVRLVTEYQYQHVYQNGADIMDPDWQPPRDEDGNPTVGIPSGSLVIYRYYDDGSTFFGEGKARDIEAYAKGLNDLILKIRSLVCSHVPKGGQQMKEADFRCHLVAHSMGGLVARAFLQNARLGGSEARKCVGKFFTFATPHNGIELLGLNVPHWLTKDEMNTFNREKMAEFLDMKAVSAAFNGRVDLIPESALPSERIFCMVGTNRGDYEVGEGLARAFVGHGSDGLVRIENASLWGVEGQKATQPAATAYAYRSHSGYFGIVNSEEAYQNLVRFLFGDVRVDIWLDVESVRLPADLEQKAGVEALYQFEIRAAPRGKRWFLTRRTAVEDSPACRTHSQLSGADAQQRRIYLSTVFLSKRGKVDQDRKSLAYAMTVAVKVPDYEIERRFWADGHYEGADLFRDTAVIELTPPDDGKSAWDVKYSWASNPDAPMTRPIDFTAAADGKVELSIDFANPNKPGISGKIRLVVRPWS